MTVKTVLIFLFITSLGSSLSSLASFFNIDSYFHGIFSVGLALSVKTFAASVFSYKAHILIKKIGLYWAFIFSQVFGCISILVLLIGFYFHSFPIVIIGVTLTGIPMALLAILVTIAIKLTTDNELSYRKHSGTREFITGLSMLIAAFLVPMLLIKIDLYNILLLDLLSFLIGIIIIKVRLSNLPIYSKTEFFIDSNIFYSKETWAFIIKVSASLLLTAIVPIFASSSHVLLTKDIPLMVKQWIWVIDAVTLMFSSFIYILLKDIKSNKLYEFIITVNGILLIIFLTEINTIKIFFGLVLISFSSSISFLKFRDDYILRAGKDLNCVASYASLSTLQKNFIQFLSPIILTILFTRCQIAMIIIVVLFIQILGYTIGNYVIKPYEVKNES